MSIDTPLINLMVIVSALLMIGVIIFMINLIPTGKFIKGLISTILIIVFLFWMINTFEAFRFLRTLITNWLTKHSF